jgi:hypothetical protein
MAALLAESANLMHNFVHMENIDHSLRSNTKLELEAEKLRPSAVEGLHSSLLVALHKQSVAHSKHQHKGSHKQVRNNHLSNPDPIHHHNPDHMLQDANRLHNPRQQKPPSRHYPPEPIMVQAQVIPLP